VEPAVLEVDDGVVEGEIRIAVGEIVLDLDAGKSVSGIAEIVRALDRVAPMKIT
jgi:hypothetical protein